MHLPKSEIDCCEGRCSLDGFYDLIHQITCILLWENKGRTGKINDFDAKVSM